MALDVEFDSSYFNLVNTSSTDNDDFKIELDEFLRQTGSFLEEEYRSVTNVEPLAKETTTIDEAIDIELEDVPIKRDIARFSSFPPLPPLPDSINLSRSRRHKDIEKIQHILSNPSLSPSYKFPKQQSIFDVSYDKESRRGSPSKSGKYDLFSVDEDEEGLFANRLENKKIDKLVHDLAMADPDYDLDDQVRAAGKMFNKSFVYQGDELDETLDKYLTAKPSRVTKPSSIGNRLSFDNDKENRIDLTKKEYLLKNKKPLRRNQQQPLMRKPSDFPNLDVFHKPALRKARASHPSNIPRLKPLTNLTNLPNQDSRRNGKSATNKLYESSTDVTQYNHIEVKSPNRVCSPSKARKLKPTRPSIKFTDKINLMVDSSTGLINDATSFATELNSTNGKGIPLPETIHEIVNIPTNDDAKVKKVAIIKGIHNKFHLKFNQGNATGFYNEASLRKYRSYGNDIQVVHDSPTKIRTNDKKRVKWAENLEW